MPPAFVSTVTTSLRKTGKPQICRRRPPISASASGPTDNSWSNTSNYQSTGNGVPSKGIQRIEFTIRQDGTVEERVTGVRGKHCDKLTEKINEALGRVVHTEKTEEFYEQVYDQVEENVNKENVSWPGAEGLPTW